jgi:general secretion pathway protein G
VELLIVVVILAILAAVAIPQFTSSAEDAKASALQANVGVMRNAMELYKLQHNGKYPGYPSAGGNPTEADFIDQMINASKADGSTAAPGTAGFTLGPYIKESIPANPVNGLSTVTVVLDAAAFPVAADGLSGWVYKPAIGKIRANSTGQAPSGDDWFDF